MTYYLLPSYEYSNVLGIIYYLHTSDTSKNINSSMVVIFKADNEEAKEKSFLPCHADTG